MTTASRVRFHLCRERQCREMAFNAAERYVARLHNELANLHAAAAREALGDCDYDHGQAPSFSVQARRHWLEQEVSQAPVMLFHWPMKTGVKG